jgi:hypothetical protein
VGKFGDIETVYALRPIYLTSKGEGALPDHGLFSDRRLPGNKVVKSLVVRTVPLRARSGYAVSGITLRTGLNINGLSLTYMRINGTVLDPRDSYLMPGSEIGQVGVKRSSAVTGFQSWGYPEARTSDTSLRWDCTWPSHQA